MPLFLGPLRNFVNFMLAIPSLQNKQFLEVPIRLWLSKCSNRGYQVSALCFGKKSDTEGTVTDEDTACSSDSDGKVGGKQRSIVAKSVQLCTPKKIQSESSKLQSFGTKSSASDEVSFGEEAEKNESSVSEDSATAPTDAKSTSAESSTVASAQAETPKPIESKPAPRMSVPKPPLDPSAIATQPSVLEAKSAQQQNPKKRESKISNFFRRRPSRSKSRNRKVSKSPAEPPPKSVDPVQGITQSAGAAQPPIQPPTQLEGITTPTDFDGSSEISESVECSNTPGANSDTEMENESVCETMANMSAPCKPMPDIDIPKRPIVTLPESESDCEPPLSNVEMRQKADESESDCEAPIESSGIYPKENESICGTWEPQKPLKRAPEMHEPDPPLANVAQTSVPEVPPTSHFETAKPTTPPQQKPSNQKMPKGRTPNTQPPPAVPVQPKPAPVGRTAPPPPNRQQIPKKEAKRRKFFQKRSPGSKSPHIHPSGPPPAQQTSKPVKQTSQKARPQPQRSTVNDNTSLGPNAPQQRPFKKPVPKQGKRSSATHKPQQKSSPVRQKSPTRYDPESHKPRQAPVDSNREMPKQRKSSDSRYLPDYSKCSQKEAPYSHTGPSHPGQHQHASQAPRTDPKVKDRKRSSSQKKTSLGPYPPDSNQLKEGPLRQHTSTERSKQTTHQSRAPQREDRSKELAKPVPRKGLKLWDRLRSKSPTQKPPASTHGQHQNQPHRQGAPHSHTSIPTKQHQPSNHGHPHKHSPTGSPSKKPSTSSMPTNTENKRCNGSPPRLKQCVPNKPKHSSFSHTESDSATDSDHHLASGSMMKTRLNRSEAVCRSLVEKTPRKAFDFAPSESEPECEAPFKQREYEPRSDLESCERDRSVYSDYHSQPVQKSSASSGPSQQPQTSTHSQAVEQPKPQSAAEKPVPPSKGNDASKKRSRLSRRRPAGSKKSKQKAAPSPSKPQVAAQQPTNQSQAIPSHAQVPSQASVKPKPAQQKHQTLPAIVASKTKQPKVSVPSRDTAKVCFGPPKMRPKAISSSLEHTDTESGTESEYSTMQEPHIGNPRHRMSESESECEFSMRADTKVRNVQSDSDCDLNAHINGTKQQPNPIHQAPKQQHKQIHPVSSQHQPKKIPPHKETPKQRDALEVSSEPFSAKTRAQNPKPEGKGYPDKGLKFWKKISYRSKILKKIRSAKKRSETNKAESKSSKPAKSATSQTKTQMQTKSAPASTSPSKTKATTDAKPRTSSTESKDKSKISFGPPKMRSKSKSKSIEQPEYSKKSATCSDNESGTDSGTECEQHQAQSSVSDAPCTKSEFAGICAEAYKTDSDVETCPMETKQIDSSRICAEANKKHSNPNQKKDESDSDCDRNKK